MFVSETLTPKWSSRTSKMVPQTLHFGTTLVSFFVFFRRLFTALFSSTWDHIDVDFRSSAVAGTQLCCALDRNHWNSYGPSSSIGARYRTQGGKFQTWSRMGPMGALMQNYPPHRANTPWGPPRKKMGFKIKLPTPQNDAPDSPYWIDFG